MMYQLKKKGTAEETAAPVAEEDQVDNGKKATEEIKQAKKQQHQQLKKAKQIKVQKQLKKIKQVKKQQHQQLKKTK